MALSLTNYWKTVIEAVHWNGGLWSPHGWEENKSSCIVCWKEDRYEHAKKISDQLSNSLYTSKKRYTSLVHNVWRVRECERREASAHSKYADSCSRGRCFVWQTSTALSILQGRQLLRMHCLDAQCKVSFGLIWKCSNTKLLWYINVLKKTRKCDYSSQTGQKENWNSFERKCFGQQRKHAGLEDTSLEIPDEISSQRENAPV
jgi:hypothetical protein